jgi:hypothetical protein
VLRAITALEFTVGDTPLVAMDIAWRRKPIASTSTTGATAAITSGPPRPAPGAPADEDRYSVRNTWPGAASP